jgi:adenine-specific DNA-methyltransferase
MPRTPHHSSFLRSHPTLVLDTRHFDPKFVDRLLGSFDDLDEMTDGVLVHSENWQALNLLTEKYRGKVKCIYIDPPYNTGDDEFIYRDAYQHSCWLGMMADRLRISRLMMSSEGALFSSIDDNEYWRRASSTMAGLPVSLDHEYVLAYGRDVGQIRLTGLARKADDYPYEDERGRYASTDLTVGMTRERIASR